MGLSVQVEGLRQYEVTEELWKGAAGVAAYCVDAHTGRRFLVKELLLPAELEERERWRAAMEERAERWQKQGWPGVAPLVRVEVGARVVRALYDDPRGLCVSRLAEEAHVLLPGQACRAALRVAERVEELRRAGADIRFFEPHCAFMVSDDECLWADLSLNDVVLSAGGRVAEGGEYLPPEAARLATGVAEEPRLVYGLGVFLHRLLTGKGPGEVEEGSPLWVLNPQVSSALDRLVGRATAKDPSERFASLGEFIDALHRLPEQRRLQPLAEVGVPVAAPGEAVSGVPEVRGPRIVAWLVGTGVALLCLAGLLLAFGLRGRRAREARELVPPRRVVAPRAVRPQPPEERAPAALPAPEAVKRGVGAQPPEVKVPAAPAREGAVPPGVGVTTPARISRPPLRPGAAPEPAPSGPVQEGGGLRVVVRPPGAEVYLDQVFIGVAAEAMLVPGLIPGQHRIRVEMEGYAPQEATVSVPKGGTAVLAVTLKPQPAEG